MVIAVKDAGEFCCAVADDIKLRAGKLGEVDVVY
jgi:hypothetical protein